MASEISIMAEIPNDIEMILRIFSRITIYTSFWQYLIISVIFYKKNNNNTYYNELVQYDNK